MWLKGEIMIREKKDMLDELKVGKRYLIKDAHFIYDYTPEEIIVLEISPSGKHIYNQHVNMDSKYWSNRDAFIVLEDLGYPILKESNITPEHENLSIAELLPNIIFKSL